MRVMARWIVMRRFPTLSAKPQLRGKRGYGVPKEFRASSKKHITAKVICPELALAE